MKTQIKQGFAGRVGVVFSCFLLHVHGLAVLILIFYQYQRIDDEHRHLFHTIWACYDNRESSYALINMVATMQQHFTYEEGCMKASKHDNYERHKQVRCLDILFHTVRYIHIIPLWLS